MTADSESSRPGVALLAAVLWGALCGVPARTAAQEAPAWSLPPEAAADRCQDALRRCETALRAVAVVPASSRSLANTPEALETALQDLEDVGAPLALLKYVAVSSAAREAGADCEARLDAFTDGVFARRDLFRAVSEFAQRGETLAGASRLLLTRELDELQAGGGGLDAEDRKELRSVRERLAAREVRFRENIEWPREALLFSPDELAGLPEAAVARLPVQGRLRKVAAEPEDYAAFMASVRDASARRRLEFLYYSRAAAANAEVLRDILSWRGRLARLLDRGSYARLVLAGRLVRDPDRVRAIIQGLRGRLRAAARQELAALSSLKKQDAGPRGDKALRAWDRAYYLTRRRQALYPLADDPAMSEYFPLDQVTDGALSVLGKFLSVSFRRVGDAPVWHPDVALYAALDADTGALLGRFYLDLIARPDKAAGPAVLVLVHGRRLPDGSRQTPACVFWASIPRPAGGGPVLLRHSVPSDLEDLFHGLGHVMALMLSQPRYGRFSGADATPEFSEALALFFGRLAWRPEVAAAVSGHVRDRSRRAPAEFLAQAAGVRGLGAALGELDAAAFALTDLEVHSGAGTADPAAAWRRNFKRVALSPVTPRAHPEAAALPLARAGACGADDVLARLLAEELWQRAGEEGFLNPMAGRHLRDTLMAAGDEPALRNFLGREPAFEAVPDPVLRPLAPPGEDLEPVRSGSASRRRLLR